MMIDGIPNRPLYFYQKDIIAHVRIFHREVTGGSIDGSDDSTGAAPHRPSQTTGAAGRDHPRVARRTKSMGHGAPKWVCLKMLGEYSQLYPNFNDQNG